MHTIKSGIWWCSLLFFFSHISLVYAVPAQENKATLIEYLTQERLHLTKAIQDSTQNAQPKDEKQYDLKTKHISSLFTMTNAKIQNLEGFLDNQNKQQNVLHQRLKYLQQLPLANAELSIQERVTKVESLLVVNKKTIELINDNLILARELKVSLSDEINELQLWKKNYELEQKLEQIKKIKSGFRKELQQLYQTNDAPVNKNATKKDADLPLQSEIKSLISNQQIGLIHQQINILNLQKVMINAQILLLKNTDTKTLQLALDTYKENYKQYTQIEKSMKQMNHELDNESQLFTTSAFKITLKNLKGRLEAQVADIATQKQIVAHQIETAQNQLKKLISSRQTLAEYNMENLPVIVSKLLEIPNILYKYVKTLALKMYDSYNWLDTISKGILWMILASTLFGFFILNRTLKSLSNEIERSRLTGYLYDGLLTLLLRNTWYICLVTMLWSGFYFTNIAYASYQLLFNLIAVWFVFRMLILIARMALLERISDSSGKDVTLYYRLKWLLLFGGWTTALMVFSHIFPLPLLIQDIFNRLFMLFVLAISLVAWNSKEVIPYLLLPFLIHKKRYFKNAISLLVILVPITLLTTALIGLFGFVNLAWTMCRYQADLLLVLVGYIVIRGLVFDVLELFSEWMISSLRNGWLWTEVFLKPIDTILRIIILLCSVLVLFQLYGWHSDSLVMTNLIKLAHYSIVNLPGIHVTVLSGMEFLMVLALFVWASKWTREFCYRWLYRNAKDVGIRNSLSIFTQYTVILLGAFITLHVLGVDFSGMSMILGGLAVGMGFGLRDFASNIIGGIMLLIERPVREGDLITIGEHEGKVAHIGIRTMRVSSWDNMEILIPNAETFNKPFTNWTHQDNIVRTVVPIKVSRVDDPVIIQQIILDVLAVVPEIETDPPAQAFLKKIDEALIEFEIRYFIDVQLYTRVEIQSKVLFAITAQFNAAGIKPPIELLAIEIKEDLNETKSKNDTIAEK